MENEDQQNQEPEFIECRPESPLKGRKIEPKYRDPQTGNTWAGRGKMPTWMQGKDKEQFRI